MITSVNSLVPTSFLKPRTIIFYNSGGFFFQSKALIIVLTFDENDYELWR